MNMKLRPMTAAVLLSLSCLALNAGADDLRRPYIVQLADKPIASYSGGIEGMPATQPADGERLDLASSDVQLYNGYLENKQQVVREAGVDGPVGRCVRVAERERGRRAERPVAAARQQ